MESQHPLQPANPPEPHHFHDILRHPPFPDRADHTHPQQAPQHEGQPGTTPRRIIPPRPAAQQHHPAAMTTTTTPAAAQRRAHRNLKKTLRITGAALVARQSLARARILEGGWDPAVSWMAVAFSLRGAWYERPGMNWGVQCFIRDAEALGEFDDEIDMAEVHRFLRENVHKFVAFCAMGGDGNVPAYVVRKAKRRGARGEGWELRFPWLWAFVREAQGYGVEDGAESLVRPFRARGEAVASGEITAPLKASCGDALEDPGIEGNTPELNTADQTGEQQSGSDSTEECVEIGDINDKRVKREPTGDEAPASLDRIEECGAGEARDESRGRGVGMPDRGQTLTVLFHGMKSCQGEDETEHVQVYVPRTAKGVTINFL